MGWYEELAKKGYIGTKAKVSVESEEEKKKKKKKQQQEEQV